jgi:hypothetical protein
MGSTDLERVQLTEILTGASEVAVKAELRRMVRRGQVAEASRLVQLPNRKGWAVKVIRIAEPRRRWWPRLLLAGGLALSVALVAAVIYWAVTTLLAALATATPFLALGLLLLALAGLGGGSVKVIQTVVIKR